VKSHYEKIIVACCFLSLFVNIGLNSTSFAVYQPYIVSMPGIGDAAGSIILSTRILVSAVATMLVNRFYDFLEARVGLSLAMVLPTTLTIETTLAPRRLASRSAKRV